MTGPVRIGVLSCARITREALLAPAAETGALAVMAVASRDQARATAYAQKHAIARAHGSYEALLADPEIEAIYNPLPNSLHAEWSIRALEAGKAVLCEKPMASNAAEAQRMADAARANGRPLVEAFHYRYHPLAARLLEIVRTEIGPVRRMEVTLTMADGFVKPDDIRWRRDLAGGATMDLGAYCINMLRFIAGGEPEVVEASAIAGPPDVDKTMRARLAFAGGVEAALTCSLAHDALGSWLLIEGENGKLEANNPFLPQRGYAVTRTLNGGEPERIRVEKLPTYSYQAAEFAAVVRDGAPIRTTAEEGVANMRVIDAVYRAAGMTPHG